MRETGAIRQGAPGRVLALRSWHYSLRISLNS